MVSKYPVSLSPEERERLEKLTKEGPPESLGVRRARALLLCDKSTENPGRLAKDVSEVIGVSASTIDRWKKRFVEQGLERALERNPIDRSKRALKFDAAFEAKLLALARSEPPEGKNVWSVRLLARKAAELGLTDSVSPMTVQRALKRTRFKLAPKNV
jgi:transposase